MEQAEALSKLSKRIKGSKEKGFSLPFILTVFKQCIKYNISNDMIKSLSYNDLLSLIIDFQIDDINQHLANSKEKKDEVIELDEEETTRFLCGKIPSQ